MSKYTPGPWLTCNHGKCKCKMVASDNGPVATITSGKWGDEYPALRIVGESSLDQKAEPYIDMIEYGEVPEEVAQANACLISAAPDLLDACKALVDGSERAIQKAQAAIAKAEGTSPLPRETKP